MTERAQVALDSWWPQGNPRVMLRGRDLIALAVVLESLDQSRQPRLMLEGRRRGGPLGKARELWVGRGLVEGGAGMRNSPKGERTAASSSGDRLEASRLPSCSCGACGHQMKPSGEGRRRPLERMLIR